MDNVPDQDVNIGGEDNVVEQGGVVAADDGNLAALSPMALCTRLLSSLGSC